MALSPPCGILHRAFTNRVPIVKDRTSSYPNFSMSFVIRYLTRASITVLRISTSLRSKRMTRLRSTINAKTHPNASQITTQRPAKPDCAKRIPAAYTATPAPEVHTSIPPSNLNLSRALSATVPQERFI
jgi:hypothetical protein